MSNESPKNRRWRSSPEIKKELAQSPNIESIRKAASLRSYLRNALLAKDYKAAAEWEQIVVLSPAGEEALQLCSTSLSQEVARADILMAAYYLFFHHELLVECAKCDLHLLHELVNTELLSGKLKWPHRFGRLLYDKFNDSYSGDRTTEVLPNVETVLGVI